MVYGLYDYGLQPKRARVWYQGHCRLRQALQDCSSSSDTSAGAKKVQGNNYAGNEKLSTLIKDKRGKVTSVPRTVGFTPPPHLYLHGVILAARLYG